jgi:hypothetical protein
MRVRNKTSLLIGLILVFGTPAAMAATANAADQLPDLRMARLGDIQLDDSTISGHRLLRFTTVIVNVGAGPFELHGSRPDTSTRNMSVTQRIYDDTGSYRDLATTAHMYYAGDGHDHWHVRNLESSVLRRLDNGVKVGAWAKQGFCFSDGGAFDLSLPGAPQSAVYTDCGYDPTLLSVTMGLSVGWGDWYKYNLAFQYIDVTDLSPGRYRLMVRADAANWFLETSDTNNFTWAAIQLTGTNVQVLSYGPSA